MSRVVRELGAVDPSAMEPEVDEAALDGLKFSRCLPKDLALATLASRLRDEPAVGTLLGRPLRVVRGG